MVPAGRRQVMVVARERAASGQYPAGAAEARGGAHSRFGQRVPARLRCAAGALLRQLIVRACIAGNRSSVHLRYSQSHPATA